MDIEKEKSENIEKIILAYESYAQKSGFSLNPNRKIVEGIVKALLKKEEKYGYRFCPCRPVTGDHEKDKKTVCPCVFHREEIEKNGRCLCNLFVKKKK